MLNFPVIIKFNQYICLIEKEIDLEFYTKEFDEGWVSVGTNYKLIYSGKFTEDMVLLFVDNPNTKGVVFIEGGTIGLKVDKTEIISLYAQYKGKEVKFFHVVTP